jgi:hypothetical protein
MDDPRVTAFINKYHDVRAEGRALFSEIERECSHLVFLLGQKNVELQSLRKRLEELNKKDKAG